jgi:hypothetical protein
VSGRHRKMVVCTFDDSTGPRVLSLESVSTLHLRLSKHPAQPLLYFACWTISVGDQAECNHAATLQQLLRTCERAVRARVQQVQLPVLV